MAEPEQQASMATTTRTTTDEVSLEGWSTRVEDLLDKDDEDGAVKLLEAVIAKLSVSVAPNAASNSNNLALAVAMSDLGALYGSRGLSLKADQLLSSALLIKQKAEAGATPEADHLSWEDAAEETTSSKAGVKSLKKPGGLQDRITTDYTWTPSTTTSINDEEDWEAAVPALLAAPSVVNQTPEPVKEKQVPKQKQRGRGAFTYGGGGNLYSDMTPEDGAANERLNQASSTGTANDHWDGGAEHVLLIDGFSPISKTKDLEDLLRPYSGQGVSIRWIDDTSAAAVFRTPVLARQALAGIRDPRFKLHKYTEADANLNGQLISLSVTDLEPPAPRPATTARVAQRMIAGALSRQGVNSESLQAKARANAGQMLQQEAERKQRLLSRQQMRDDAWGQD